jgi:hypothetical protein
LQLFFFFFCPACSLENYEQIWKAIFSYSIHAGLRLLSLGTGFDVCGMIDVETFPEFLHTDFVFAIHCHCECNRHSSIITVSLDVTTVFSSGCWRHGMLEGRRTTFIYFGIVSLLVGYTGTYRTKAKYWPCSLFLFHGAVVDRTI